MLLVTPVKESVVPDGTTSVALDRAYPLWMGRA
jgi:hypothetical protein